MPSSVDGTPDTREQDAHLLGRVAGGDEGAFAVLFDRHSPVVLGLLVRILGSRSEAEEVLQEAFLQAWEGAARFDAGRASVKGWLLMLARSRALDRLRSARSRRLREERVAHDERERGAAEEPLGTARLEGHERRRRVASALAGLPAEQRLCIELAYFEGLTQSQIASRLAAPLGTVKSRVLLGMRKLREILAAGP